MKGMFSIFMVILLFPSVCLAGVLRWDASKNADGYKIYYNEYSRIVGNVTEYNTDGLNLNPGVEYTFYVTAYNKAGESGRSNTVVFTKPEFIPTDNPAPTAETKPSAPSGLSMVMQGFSMIFKSIFFDFFLRFLVGPS